MVLFLRTVILVTLGLCSSVIMAEQMRVWTSQVGTTLEAEMVKVEGSQVVLRGADGIERTLPISALSGADQRFIEEETTILGNTRIDAINAEAGKVSGPIQCAHDPNWSYYIYLPKAFHDARRWPVWYVMSASGGRNGRPLNRYSSGADLIGAVVVLSVESRNRFEDSDRAVAAMVKDVNERVPVIPQLSFSSGMSGGARMAYWLAESDRNIAGVLPCGADSGIYPVRETVQFREAKLRPSTFIYSLVGTNCFNRTGTFQSHEKFPPVNRLRFFPGNHAWANADLIAEGMARVYGAGLENYNQSEATQLRNAYASTMFEFAQGKVEKEPWEAFYWANYLRNFNGDAEVKALADRMTRDLRDEPLVRLHLQAEREMIDFGKRYYQIAYLEDAKSNSARSRDGNRLAERFAAIPYGEIFRRLGEPSRAPGGG